MNFIFIHGGGQLPLFAFFVALGAVTPASKEVISPEVTDVILLCCLSLHSFFGSSPGVFGDRIVFDVGPADEGGLIHVFDEGETLFCFSKMAIDHSIEGSGVVCDYGGMDIQRSRLDDTGKRL